MSNFFPYQPTAEIHKYSLYVCESEGQVILYAVLFGYKGLLQVIALILAFRTRKVKLKGLDDSKYIAAAIYVTSIVLAVIIVSTYTLRAYENVYPGVVGIGFLLGTTMILTLVFVPRVSAYFVNLRITGLGAILNSDCFHKSKVCSAVLPSSPRHMHMTERGTEARGFIT